MIAHSRQVGYGYSMDKNVAAWFKNDSLFKQELIKGVLWQLYVAEKFRHMGYDVERVDVSITTVPEERREEFINSKDLVVNGKLIEVKSRNLDFANHSDFPYSTLFVDTKDGFLKKKDRPAMYVCVSQKTGGLCALDVASTFEKWTVKRTWDTIRKINLVAYECDKSLWESVDDAAKKLL